MSNQFVGQLQLVGFNFAPVQWAFAAGQLLPISQNTALFSLLGTQYGGNGTSNFGLPNLQGNCAIGQGSAPGLSTYDIGDTGGTTAVTLISSQMPSHSHASRGLTSRAEVTDPTNAAFGQSDGLAYSTASQPSLTPLNPSALAPFNGGNQPHNNLMPYLSMNWIIALSGVFPSRD
jgi:microcystin-dependent protein